MSTHVAKCAPISIHLIIIRVIHIWLILCSHECTRRDAVIELVISYYLLSVAENANAPDNSGIRAEEARCENRTLRRGACQVSFQIPLT